MEVKLYTRKEASDILKKYPDKVLKTKQVVTGLCKDKEGTEHEVRMFYIVELIKRGCYRYTILFREEDIPQGTVRLQLVRKYKNEPNEDIREDYDDIDSLRADMKYFIDYFPQNFDYIVARKVTKDKDTGNEIIENLWTFGNYK